MNSKFSLIFKNDLVVPLVTMGLLAVVGLYTGHPTYQEITKTEIDSSDKQSSEMKLAEWQKNRTECLVTIAGSFALCKNLDDVQLSFEYYLIENFEGIFRLKESIDEINKSKRTKTTAISLAGETLLYLGWQTNDPDEFIDRLSRRAAKLGIERRELYANDQFKAFVAAAIQDKNKRWSELEKHWPETWGPKPEKWEGIFSSKNMTDGKSNRAKDRWKK